MSPPRVHDIASRRGFSRSYDASTDARRCEENEGKCAILSSSSPEASTDARRREDERSLLFL